MSVESGEWPVEAIVVTRTVQHILITRGTALSVARVIESVSPSFTAKPASQPSQPAWPDAHVTNGARERNGPCHDGSSVLCPGPTRTGDVIDKRHSGAPRVMTLGDH